MKRVVVLRDGREALLRSAAVADAAAILAFDHVVADQDLLQGKDLGDEILSEDHRREWLEASLGSAGCLILLAEVGGHVVGFLEFRVRAAPVVNSHVGRFYIALTENFWGFGLGTAMMESMLDWAMAIPSLEKISMGVMSSNTRAIALYAKLGFVEEGRKRREYRAPNGGFLDEILMAKFLSRER